jgi:hypothetical protein
MRTTLRSSASAWRTVVVGSVLAIFLSGCVVYARPGPRYYGAEIAVAPPPPRVVVEPEPRPGYVWTAGYWSWNGHEHVWTEGTWIAERPGYHWAPAHWVEVNGNWRFVRGHWQR